MVFKNQIFGYYPGEYFNLMGFIPKEFAGGQLIPDEEAIRFYYRPYKINSLIVKDDSKYPNVEYLLSIAFSKDVRNIKIPQDSYYRYRGNILLHANPESKKLWLDIHMFGGIAHLRSYSQIAKDYDILKQAVSNYEYMSQKKDQKLDSLNDRMDKAMSELTILRPENTELVDSVSSMRNSSIDTVKRLEHFRRKAETFEGMYEESVEMVKQFGIISTSLRNLVVSHAKTMDSVINALTSRDVTKVEELSAEIEKYKKEANDIQSDVEQIFEDMKKIKEKQEDAEEKQRKEKTKKESGITNIAALGAAAGGKTPAAAATATDKPEE